MYNLICVGLISKGIRVFGIGVIVFVFLIEYLLECLSWKCEIFCNVDISWDLLFVWLIDEG